MPNHLYISDLYTVSFKLDVPDTPRVHILEEQFKTDHVKLVLELTPSSNRPTTYSVNVVPQVDVNFTERTSVQLNVPYNTQHNVSVVATLCREEKRRTNNFEVNYGEPTTPHTNKLQSSLIPSLPPEKWVALGMMVVMIFIISKFILSL